MPEPDISSQETLPNLTRFEKMPINVPAFIGPYQVESLYSKGGMSLLYLAKESKSAKPLMIKVLSPHFAKNKEVVDRFLKEAKIISMTNHPNIIKLYDQGKWENGLYITMEFIQGISLKQFIIKKSLSRKRALEIILQVAYALCHLHTHGVIHRDLKPENILITESGNVKVIDFGIAQLQNEAVKHTGKAKTIGTPLYMSPEQKKDPAKIDYNSDIYSLGIITYELLLGQLSHGVFELNLLPPHLRAILAKTLQPDAKKRTQDIVDFITDISEYLKTHEEEKEEEKQADEMMDSLVSIQNILFTHQPPLWPQFDIGIAAARQQTVSGQYLDFFKLANNSFIVLLVQPLTQGIFSLARTSSLRGMMRTFIKYSEKEKIDALYLTEHLNNFLYEDPFHQKSAMSCIIFDPIKNMLTSLTCGDHHLYFAGYVQNKIINISSQNPLLGESPNSSFEENTNTWQPQDQIIITSRYQEKQSLEKEIETCQTYSASSQAEKLLEKLLVENKEDKTFFFPSVVTIHRKE